MDPTPDIPDPLDEEDEDIDTTDWGRVMGVEGPSGRLAREAVKAHPRHGAKTIARALHDKHPAIFATLNAAVCSVRRVLGVRGGKHRRNAADKSLYRPARAPGEMPPLPKSEAKPMRTVKLDCQRCLILGDIHLPFQDNAAIAAALEYGEEYKPDLVLLNGDVFDFYQLSQFRKDTSVAKLKAELEAGKKFFARLRHVFPEQRIVFRYGNHDRRWDYHLMQCAPILWEALPALVDIWHADAGITEHRIEVIREKCNIKLGKLLVLHGDELPRGSSSPVNAARGVFIKTFVPTYVSHFHQESKQPAKTPEGKRIMTWSSGALCGLSPDYLPINQWTTGFGTVDVRKNGHYRVTQLSIIDGEIY